MGRAAELADVRRALRGAGLIVAGPAGVGKTRLLEAAGVPLVRATTATASIPLGVLAPWLPPDIPEGPLAMLHAARDSLRGKVIGVDDAHLLDDTSAVLLHQLAQHREAVVVATIRSGTPAPAPVVALWKDQLLDRLDLEPLGFADFTSVLTEVLGGPVDSRAADRLWTATAGNLLLLRELLLAAPLAEVDGLWRLDGPLPMSPRLAELIDHRLGALAPEQRRVLELLAFGEPLGFELFDPGVLESLDDFVTASEEGLRLAHPLYGEALRAGCPPLRTHTHQRYLASVLDDPLRVAVLRLDSGSADDPELLLTAAGRACLLGDVVLAERLARAAWALGGGPPAAHLLAQVLAFTDRSEEAEEVFAMVASADDPVEIVAMRAMNIGWGLGRSAEAAAMVDTPLVQANLLFDAGKYAEALAVLPGAEPAEAVIEALINAVQGREPREIPELETWEAVPLGAEMFTSAKVFIRTMYGDLQGVEEIAVEAHRSRSEWDSMRSHWAIVRAGLARARGRLDDAMVLLREAQPVRPFFRLCELAHVEALRGNDARDLLAAAEALVPQGQRPYRCGLWQARIWAGGASPLEFADDARAHGEHAVEAMLLHEAVRLGHAGEAVDRLVELASFVHGRLVPLYGDHALALVRNDNASLERVASGFEEAGVMLHAAEAAAASGNRALFARLVARCQSARTPALARFTVPRLTKRELEVASLAARGLTNREIAESLVTSVRTIDNHLSSVYAKLGIGARSELTDAMGFVTGIVR
ncbi:LuxR family transcriptional regulator [Lentzea sp. NBRC 105346]|nr:LuxR family transcriptional regulator [Lentzea sp. NBRC 105346]